MATPNTWLIIGASRGIGLEFVRHNVFLGHRVIATARGSSSALDTIHQNTPDRVKVLTCDVSSSDGINVWFAVDYEK
jgi:NAD(P)-dependent dehydrogenase (short-subunit alcohol dehydrogenase family)